jgi:hypothetical protein
VHTFIYIICIYMYIHVCTYIYNIYTYNVYIGRDGYMRGCEYEGARDVCRCAHPRAQVRPYGRICTHTRASAYRCTDMRVARDLDIGSTAYVARHIRDPMTHHELIKCELPHAYKDKRA